MKKIITLTALIIFANAKAQQIKESNVPSVVREAFKSLHPHVKNTEWSKEGKFYEVEFETKQINQENGKSRKGDVETTLVYDSNGKLIQTEIEIPVSELPAAAKEYVNSNYPGKKISEAAKITDANAVITYEAEVGKVDLIFDANGKFIKKEVDDDTEKETKK
jgi:hypothetical protein